MTVPAAAVQCASALIRDDGTGGRRGLGHPFLHFKFFLRSSNTYSIGSIVKINRLMQRNIRNTFFDMHWCFPISKKAPRPLLLTCTRPALHALTTRVSSLMAIYSVVPSTANRSYFEKPCKVKMWNLVTNIESLFLRILLMKNMSFTDELFKFPFLLFTTWPPTLNALSPAPPVDIMQNVYLYILQDHWVLDTPICHRLSVVS